MTRFFKSVAVTFGVVMVMAIAGTAPGYALTAKECSVKYKAAKASGTLGTTTWNEFRKGQCGDGAAPLASAGDKPVIKPSAGTLAANGAVFPKAVAAKYASEKPGKSRLHTCRDQYHANKASNGNGGLRWIQKGGGYYSLCNKSLKS